MYDIRWLSSMYKTTVCDMYTSVFVKIWYKVFLFSM